MISNKLRIGAILLASSPQFAKAADAMNDRDVGGVVGGVYSGNRGGPGLAAGRYGSPGGELGGGDRFGGGGYYYYGTGIRQFNGIPAGGGYAGYGDVVVRGPGAWNGGAVYPGAAGYAWRHRFGWNGYADDSGSRVVPPDSEGAIMVSDGIIRMNTVMSTFIIGAGFPTTMDGPDQGSGRMPIKTFISVPSRAPATIIRSGSMATAISMAACSRPTAMATLPDIRRLAADPPAVRRSATRRAIMVSAARCVAARPSSHHTSDR